MEGTEQRLETEFEPQLEAAAKEQRAEANELMTATNEVNQRISYCVIKYRQLIAQKKSLLQRCESLVCEVAAAEADLSAEVKKVFEEGQRKVDASRRQFKAGAEERQKKQIAARLAELMESTAAAMEPEFSRLRLAHEREVAETEAAGKHKERNELAELEKQHQSRIAAEEKRLREEHQSRSRLQLDAAIAAIERSERDHKQKLERLQRELEAEHRRYCIAQEQQYLSHGDDVCVAEDALQNRLASLRKQHAGEVSALEKEHTSKVCHVYECIAMTICIASRTA